MQAQKNIQCQNIVETLFQEFNGNSIYGLEFIVNELHNKNDMKILDMKDVAIVDWFGLSDLSI